MNGVVLPEPVAVEKTMRPIQDEIFADEKDDHLRHQRQRRERAVAVLVEGDQAVGGGDSEQNRGAGDKHADAQETRDDGNEKPVADVGDEVRLAPPGTAGIAGPEPRQHGEDERKRQRDRHAFHERFADFGDERQQFVEHIGTASRRLRGFSFPRRARTLL